MTYNYLLSKLYQVRAIMVILQGYADNLQKIEFDDAIEEIDELITNIKREGIEYDKE